MKPVNFRAASLGQRLKSFVENLTDDEFLTVKIYVTGSNGSLLKSFKFSELDELDKKRGLR